MQLPVAMPKILSCEGDPHVKNLSKALVTCNKTLTSGNKYTLLTVYKGSRQHDKLVAEGSHSGLRSHSSEQEGIQKNPSTQSVSFELHKQLNIMYD